jgi:hypothetical protein
MPQRCPANGFEDRGLPSTAVHRGPLGFNGAPFRLQDRLPRGRPVSVELAVFFAVSRPIDRDSYRTVQDSTPCASTITSSTKHAVHAATALAPSGPIGPND